MTATDKAEELGATAIEGGINWTWAKGLEKSKAEEFLKWLDANGYEHRGMYGTEDVNIFDVRYRRA